MSEKHFFSKLLKNILTNFCMRYKIINKYSECMLKEWEDPLFYLYSGGI